MSYKWHKDKAVELVAFSSDKGEELVCIFCREAVCSDECWRKHHNGKPTHREQLHGMFDFQQKIFEPAELELDTRMHGSEMVLLLDGREIDEVWYCDTEQGIVKTYDVLGDKLPRVVTPELIMRWAGAALFNGRDIDAVVGCALSETLRGKVELYGPPTVTIGCVEEPGPEGPTGVTGEPGISTDTVGNTFQFYISSERKPCRDCKGTGQYTGARVVEVCKRCNGSKVEPRFGVQG